MEIVEDMAGAENHICRGDDRYRIGWQQGRKLVSALRIFKSCDAGRDYKNC